MGKNFPLPSSLLCILVFMSCDRIGSIRGYQGIKGNSNYLGNQLYLWLYTGGVGNGEDSQLLVE